jgi:acetyl-CoA carboxylase carboxyl transferase subunit beta
LAWFRKDKKPLKAQDRRDVPGDVFDKCPGCGDILYSERLAQNLNVCPTCGHHLPISAEEYVELLIDEDTFEEMDDHLRSADPLRFRDLKAYPDRIAAEEAKGKTEALISGVGNVLGMPVALAVMDFSFIAGSMGSVVGEKIARAGRTSLKRGIPLIIVSASGGARMQEGIYSLMQMAKTAAVLARLHEAGIPVISVMTNPTSGGVTASFAMLGDANLAEPGAFIGFAGPRVIEETIKQELPLGFQRAEFLLERGMVDQVVDRRALRDTVALLLGHMTGVWAETR